MANGVESNGLCTEELNGFRRRATRLKFASSLMQGIGGATLFGLVSSLVINSAAVLALPTLALIAVPLVGISCIFIGTKCMLEAQLLDQEMGAKMTGAAVNRGQSVQTPEEGIDTAPTKITTLPVGMAPRADSADASQMAANENDSVPAEAEEVAPSTPWAERVTSKRAAAEMNAAPVKAASTPAADASWAEALRASAAQDADKDAPAVAARA